MGVVLRIPACFLALVAGLLAPVPFGCGGEGGSREAPRDAGPGGDDDDDDGGLTVASFCRDRANGYVDYLQDCFGTDTYPESVRPRLVDNLGGGCARAASGVEAGRIAFDPEAAAACLAAVRDGGCVAGVNPRRCTEVFRGLVPAGGACFWSEGDAFLAGTRGCAEGFCGFEDRTCPSVCRPWPAVGEPCEPACGPEAYCDFEADRCARRPVIGESCSPTETCAEGSRCAGEPPSCRRVVETPDEPCGADDVCPAGTFCVEGNCRVEVPLGDPCNLRRNCPRGAICAPGVMDGPAVCRSPPAVGDPCFSGLPCAEGAVCAIDAFPNGTCASLPGEDEPCIDGSCGEGLYCAFATEGGDLCRARGAAGDDCLNVGAPFDGACRDGLFCANAGECVEPGGEGDPCSSFSTESCRDGFWCDRASGTCTAAQGGDGDPCNPLAAESCAGDLTCHCEANDWNQCGAVSREQVATDVCRPVRPAGAECFRDQECGLDAFCDRVDPDSATAPGVCLSADDLLCLP